MVFNRYQPEVAKRLAEKLKPISLLIFVVFVILALTNNIDNFLSSIGSVFILVLLHNALALTVGFFAARFAGLNFATQKTIAIETGIQNSGLGLLLIFSFFSGIGGMAIIAAWWGIWHVVSGLTLAYYWSRSVASTQSV
jgi:bile acid:Na+ symporter, BASS family